jgi:hypothetical protein
MEAAGGNWLESRNLGIGAQKNRIQIRRFNKKRQRIPRFAFLEFHAAFFSQELP